MNADIALTFETVYEREADAIFRYCLRRVSSRNQAVDLMQETFLRFWRSLVREDTIDNARAFLFTIARNLVIDWYRKKKEASLDQVLDLSTGMVAGSLEPLAVSNGEIKAEGRYLIRKIDDLAAAYRDVLQLRFIEGWSLAEIAQFFDISANAVSLRIHKGLAELRKLTGYDQDGSH